MGSTGLRRRFDARTAVLCASGLLCAVADLALAVSSLVAGGPFDGHAPALFVLAALWCVLAVTTGAAGRLGERDALPLLLAAVALVTAAGFVVPLLPWRLLCLSVLPVVPLLSVMFLRRRQLAGVMTAGCAGAVLLVLHLGLDGVTLAVALWTEVFVVALPTTALAVMTAKLDAVRARAEHSARTDALTGLLNRHGLAQDVPGAVAAAAASGERVGVLVLDVDRFKAVNDSFGHTTGDRVLVAVAAAVRGELRQSDVVVRWGGEEVAVVTRVPDDEALRVLAERLRLSVARMVVPGVPPVTVSVGTATSSAAGCAPEAARDLVSRLLDRADEALYEAKRAGRDRVVAHVAADRTPEPVAL